MQDIAQALKFVKGAVSNKDFVGEFTHFRIRNNTIMAFNGRMSLCHPIDLDLDISPKAKFFERALAAVPQDTPVSITMTKTGQLSVKAGNFRVRVQCHADIQDDFFPQPQGEKFDMPQDFMQVLADVYPFTAEDASRPWAQAVKFDGQSAYATNNMIMLQRWMPAVFPTSVVVPKEALKEVLRIGICPSHIQVGPTSVTLHFPNGAWLRSQLLVEEWPDVSAIINQPTTGLMDVPANFHADMKRLEGFVDDSGLVYIRGTTMGTTMVDGEGAFIETAQPLGDAAFHVAILIKLAAVAHKIDCRNSPAVFTAPNMRGVALAIRTANAPVR